MSRAVNTLIERLTNHFGEPKFDVPDTQKPAAHRQWLRDMINALSGASEEVLDKAATIIIETRQYRSFPLISDCKKAANEAAEQINRTKPRLPLNTPDRKAQWAPWTEERMKLADELIMAGDVGRRAAQEGWILSLWDFCRNNSRLPSNDRDIRRCIDGARGADETYAKAIRGEYGLLSSRLVVTGDEIMARRERLRAMVLEGVISNG